MVKLCLMASQGYLPGFVFHPQQGLRRLSQDCQPVLLSPEPGEDVIRPGFLSMRLLGPHQNEQPWKPTIGLLANSQFVSIDSAIRRPVPIDVQDTWPNSILFSFGIAKQCTKQGEILKFLTPGSSEMERCGLDLSILTDLMALQGMPTEMYQTPYKPDHGHDVKSWPTLFYPSSEFYFEKPLLDLVADLAHKSEIMVHPDGQVELPGAQTEMKDVLSVIAEFYLSKNSTKWRKQSLLLPQFDRLDSAEAMANIRGPSKLEATTVVPLKSPQKTRLKPSHKKKTNRKAGRERELYRKNHFYSCESLLSIIVDKKRQRKTAILELKKSGPELTQLLTQFSASIAGTGLALLFSVVCKSATSRVPFCASKLLNTGLGLGLVWLSWAVNRLRDTIVHISKNSGKWALNDEEMMKNLDRNVREISFRAVTLMAVMALRFA